LWGFVPTNDGENNCGISVEMEGNRKKRERETWGFEEESKKKKIVTYGRERTQRGKKVSDSKKLRCERSREGENGRNKGLLEEAIINNTCTGAESRNQKKKGGTDRFGNTKEGG